MPRMTPAFPLFRVLAFVLVIVLMATLGMPTKAEADVLAAITIGTLVVAGVIVIVYLIVANVAGSRRAEERRIVWVACAGTDCGAATSYRVADPPPGAITEAP